MFGSNRKASLPAGYAASTRSCFVWALALYDTFIWHSPTVPSQMTNTDSNSLLFASSNTYLYFPSWIDDKVAWCCMWMSDGRGRTSEFGVRILNDVLSWKLPSKPLRPLSTTQLYSLYCFRWERRFSYAYTSRFLQKLISERDIYMTISVSNGMLIVIQNVGQTAAFEALHT